MENEQLSYDLFVKRLMICFGMFSYLCCGLYYCYPEALDMVFWPFNYGWFSH